MASTGYCLANEGAEYVALVPEDANGTLQMTLRPGKYSVQWIRLVRGRPKDGGSVRVDNGRHEFRPPWNGPAVLHLKKAKAQ